MRIHNTAELQDGVNYWYVGVRYDCHWKVYSRCEKYKDGHDWSNMIVFDNKEDAKKFMEQLQNYVDPYIIK